MKTTPRAWLVIVITSSILSLPLFSLALSGEEIQIGDTEATVKAILGEPTGYIKTTSFQLFFYDRGKVEFHDGKVSTATIVSEEEAETQKTLDAEIERKRQEVVIAQREQHFIEGEKIKQMKLSNPDFVQGTFADQVNFWKVFRKKYPGVSVDNEYVKVLAGLEQEVAEEQARVEITEKEARLQGRLAELEKRLADAEARTREAVALALQNRSRVIYTTPYVYYYTSYTPSISYHPPHHSTIVTPTTSTRSSFSITTGSSPHLRFGYQHTHSNYKHASVFANLSRRYYQACSTPIIDYSRSHASTHHSITY